ncbi:pancreatic lipase-related protein 2 isoform X1 [Dendroctonus ponderosae]|uniref:pancreatic lipase-related protein 2 isoform X1 n=1 Tax=Dendroctonus ponderosae TaxID=77166 RepID=UPI0020365A9B|nr:pancreatic lipase-related protein 2 isoform X1 [Dendroctonus ponderosae]KAH1002997.1 hypothetical protein HUJ05_010950 [Dendroctonus ponderosae]
MLRKMCLFLSCALLIDAQLFFPLKAARQLTERLRAKLSQYRDRTRERNTQMICYDVVGCFSLPHKNSPLQKVPESPAALDTKFLLFTRQNRTEPELLHYADASGSLRSSSFNVFKPLKVLIHGYTSKWNQSGAVQVKDAYLQLYDCNVLLVDWQNGARGPQYTSAAANTELVGRQLGILLLSMVEGGLQPHNIHVIGFSLGAHVAGAASEPLKIKGHLMGRITGLDAASPLFRSNHFREKNKKLDRTDARYVDVLHTDASPFLADGFGLWEPIGHADFFPNGGQQQPGCRDRRSSVLITQLEGGKLTRESACSHIRAFQLFTETISSKLGPPGAAPCQFIAYSCPGGMPAFEKGHCFPQLPKGNLTGETGLFGEDSTGEGIMYFSTRASSPYCGTQLQASVYVAQRTSAIKGVLQIALFYPHHSVTFHIETNTKDFVMSGSRMDAVAVAPFRSLDPLQTPAIHTNLHFFPIQVEEEEENRTAIAPGRLYVDKIVVRDMWGNSWQHSEKELMVSDSSPKRLILRTV